MNCRCLRHLSSTRRSDVCTIGCSSCCWQLICSSKQRFTILDSWGTERIWLMLLVLAFSWIVRKYKYQRVRTFEPRDLIFTYLWITFVCSLNKKDLKCKKVLGRRYLSLPIICIVIIFVGMCFRITQSFKDF